MSATIRDIKEKTGLSLSTISKYLNGRNVLPENQARIEAAIQELHYEVNEIARGLVTNRTRTVGVVVYSVESLFNGTLLHHIGNALREERYGIFICDSCNDEKIEAENIRFLLKKKVDGIIVVPVSRKQDFLNPARDADVPVVLLDRSLSEGAFDCVRIDNRKAAFEAVKILLNHNHRKIAIICSDSEHEYTGYERYKGYLDAMEQAGLEIVGSYQKQGCHSIEFGQASMKELLCLKDPPTAVLLCNYEISLGAVISINELGIRCPEDISLFGFDDLILSHLVKPQLYMVVQPMRDMGEKAVEILLHHIGSKEKTPPVEIVMNTSVRTGNSIAKVTSEVSAANGG
ncbi:LacI family transcriptional regulator [bacterium C-53]|nr:LacI family transcriptional regulator [Lachnospiraceae bacterium]NBI03445.1 LacI family transcriptional regulator [Lachnospiraceae bacterium]RKJ09684.1 LacI family transcriptional regulator [bacterium C-53]